MSYGDRGPWVIQRPSNDDVLRHLIWNMPLVSPRPTRRQRLLARLDKVDGLLQRLEPAEALGRLLWLGLRLVGIV